MKPKAKNTPPAPPVAAASWTWVFLLLALFFFAAIRLRLLEVPLERDEGEYAYAGQLLLEGVPPYQLAANLKLPGTYGMYALIMAVFGQTPAGIHLGLIVANSLTIVLMFLLGRHLFGPGIGLSVGLSYGLLSLNPGVLGLAAHANHFVVLFAIAGMLLLLRAEASPDGKKYFGSGVLFGLALLMKQHGLMFGVFGGFWLLWREWKNRERDWPRRNLTAAPEIFSLSPRGTSGERVGVRGQPAKRGEPHLTPALSPPSEGAEREKTKRGAKPFFLFLSGGILPLALTGLLLGWAGVWDRFWFWTVVYAREYATAEPLSHAWRNFQAEFAGVIRFNPILWPLAGLGGLLCLLEKNTRRQAVFLGGLLVCSILAFSAGFYFRQQYYILLLPVFALLIGAAASAAKEYSGQMKSALWPVLLPGGILAAAMASDVWAQRAIYFQLTPQEASRAMYSLNPFLETALIADYIKKNSAPNATVAVLGSEPQIYFLARRRAATSYLYTYALMENHPHALAMQEEMIREIEAAPPDFLVMVGMPFSWIPRPTSPKRIFQWFDEFWPKGYELVGLMDFIAEAEPEVHWGQDAAGRSPQSGNYLYVFQRKSVF